MEDLTPRQKAILVAVVVLILLIGYAIWFAPMWGNP